MGYHGYGWYGYGWFLKGESDGGEYCALQSGSFEIPFIIQRIRARIHREEGFKVLYNGGDSQNSHLILDFTHVQK